MAKWKSPIFSDIRNKLGENVVFSMWKGRQYMRSYTKPSNPKTNAQTANRLHMNYLVSTWQGFIATIPPLVTSWNAAALSDLISGYNRFVKGARGYVVSAPTLAHGSFSLTVVSSKLPLNDLRLVVLTASNAVKSATKQTLGTYTSADFDSWTPATGDKIYLRDEKAAAGEVLTAMSLDDFASQLQFVDETNGVLVPVTLT
jgi:hypothetical protein